MQKLKTVYVLQRYDHVNYIVGIYTTHGAAVKARVEMIRGWRDKHGRRVAYQFTATKPDRIQMTSGDILEITEYEVQS